MGIQKSFAGTRLHGTMLDLDHLRTHLHEGQETALGQEWLHREEQERLQTLHYEKRHLEWLGGRICAKQASLQYLHDNNLPNWGQNSILSTRTLESATLCAPQLQIMTAASGRPLLDNSVLPGDLSPPHISISHSRRYALAVAASTPCGIDIQVTSDALGRVKERFCSQEEEGLLGHELEGLQLPDRLTLLWAAKEAVKKGAELARMPGFLDLALTHIEISAKNSIRPFAVTAGLADCLFTLDYQDSHQESGNPQLQFQVTVCLHQGYGIGLYVLPAQACPKVNHA
jgi:4'-phosphopantetheinyl transferase EntD